MAYKKAPAYEGKDLTLQVGRADMKILDGVKYTDDRLARFVGMGFLVNVPADDKAPTVATGGEKRVAKAPAPAPAAPKKEEEDTKAKEAAAASAAGDGGSVSKSPASKSSKGGGSKKKDKE